VQRTRARLGFQKAGAGVLSGGRTREHPGGLQLRKWGPKGRGKVSPFVCGACGVGVWVCVWGLGGGGFPGSQDNLKTKEKRKYRRKENTENTTKKKQKKKKKKRAKRT